jgi:carboxylate-amine ligase
MVDALLRHVRPWLEDAGEWHDVSSLVRETLDRGNGARLQRAALERTGRMEDVVDLIVSETERGVV